MANSYNVGQLIQSAKNGDSKAQLSLGLLYCQGRGVEKNYSAAADLFKKAIAGGNNEALIFMGILCVKGQGVPQDYAKAMDYFRRSDETGSVKAAYYIGVMYRDGLGVEKDYSKASEWLERADDLGDTRAEKVLKDIKSKSEIVPVSTKSQEDATKELIAAIEKNDLSAVAASIAAGADVNNRNQFSGTPLMLASMAFSYEIVKLLIDSKADINAIDNEGSNALDCAFLRFSLPLSANLEGITDTNYSYEEGYMNALLTVSRREGNNSIEDNLSNTLKIIELLLNSQCKLKKSTVYNALLWVAVSGCESLLKLLIKHGVDLNSKDENGNTVLIFAVLNHASPKIVKILIENGADAYIKNNSGIMAGDIHYNHSYVLLSKYRISLPSSLQEAALKAQENAQMEWNSASIQMSLFSILGSILFILYMLGNSGCH